MGMVSVVQHQVKKYGNYANVRAGCYSIIGLDSNKLSFSICILCILRGDFHLTKMFCVDLQ